MSGKNQTAGYISGLTPLSTTSTDVGKNQIEDGRRFQVSCIFSMGLITSTSIYQGPSSECVGKIMLFITTGDWTHGLVGAYFHRGWSWWSEWGAEDPSENIPMARFIPLFQTPAAIQSSKQDPLQISYCWWYSSYTLESSNVRKFWWGKFFGQNQTDRSSLSWCYVHSTTVYEIPSLPFAVFARLFQESDSHGIETASKKNRHLVVSPIDGVIQQTPWDIITLFF